MIDERTLELVAFSILAVLMLAVIVINMLPAITWPRKAKKEEKSPLSDESKELLSKKIKIINNSSGEDELSDYVWKILIKKDYSILAENTETLVSRFESDVSVAKSFRDYCQEIMDNGSEVDASYVFSLEDEFFDKYKRVKVLKLTECDNSKTMRMALEDIHKSSMKMVEYLSGFRKKARSLDLNSWQDRAKYNLSKEKLVM